MLAKVGVKLWTLDSLPQPLAFILLTQARKVLFELILVVQVIGDDATDVRE